MMAKKYNIVTGPNHKVVDQKIDQIASNFICGCNHLTPATEAELDNLFAEMNRNTPEKNSDTVCEPDIAVIEALETPLDDFLDVEPPPAAYEYDQARATH